MRGTPLTRRNKGKVDATGLPAGRSPAFSRRRCVAVFIVVTLGLLTDVAHAKAAVLEIGADGALIRHDSPALFLAPNLVEQPIERSRTRAPISQGAVPPNAEVADALRRASSATAIDRALLDAVACRNRTSIPRRSRPRALSA